MGDGERTEIERRAREVFESSVENLDGETRSRLNRARQAALAEIRRGRGLRWQAWLPVAAAASVAMLAVVLWRWPGDTLGPTARGGDVAPAPEVVELLGSDADLVTEDPEFYAWLSARGLLQANGSG
jgi:hypothetical protein